MDETTTGLLIGERVKFVGVFFRFGGGEEDGGESVVARTENEPEEEESVNLKTNQTVFFTVADGRMTEDQVIRWSMSVVGGWTRGLSSFLWL